MRAFRFIITLILFLSISHLSKAQKSRDHLSAGIGIGMIYADNAGIYKFMQFKTSPVFSVNYQKEISERFDLRFGIATQWMDSGEFRPLNSPIVIEWGNNGMAYYFKGIAYSAEVVPIYYLNPNATGAVGESINFYVGLGLGGVYSERNQRVLRDAVIENGIFVSGFVDRSRENTFSPIVPFKIGFTSNFEYEWDLGVELGMTLVTNSQIDGNTMTNKLFKPDMLANVQFIVRRYIRR